MLQMLVSGRRYRTDLQWCETRRRRQRASGTPLAPDPRAATGGSDGEVCRMDSGFASRLHL